MEHNLLLFGIPNETLLLILMSVLIAFIVLLTILGIVFIVALRKRRPVVKVLMAPVTSQPAPQPQPEAQPAPATAEAPAEVSEAPAEPAAPPVAEEPEPEPEEEEEDEESRVITEGHETVRYNRSFVAKICQLNSDAKEWYSDLKNDLLSYEKIKARTSWKRESFHMGRLPVARLVVRGKTLCLLLAVEPISYSGTKYSVEDVSNVANTVDTPTLYRIKSARRLKYAKEMIAGMMREYKSYKDPRYEAQDYFVPYEGDVSLMRRGLIKRVVSGSTRSFRIEEVDPDELETAASEDGENV